MGACMCILNVISFRSLLTSRTSYRGGVGVCTIECIIALYLVLEN